jgi:CBS domain-containing protein
MEETVMSLARFRGPVFHVDADVSILSAAREMRDRHIGCLVVTREKHPIGIVTDRDLVLRGIAEGLDCASTPLSRCVTFDPVTVGELDGIPTAVERMRSAGVRRLPVVDAEGKVVGIVTADDLFAELGRELSSLCEGIENSSDASDSR